MTKKTRFNFDWKVLRSRATANQCWRSCSYSRCRKRSRCMGGPRGTQRKFGKPKCSVRFRPGA